MKNILYIGPYKENTGLGRASRRYVDALGYNLNINLSIRPIYFTKNLDYANESGKDYIEFEDNSSKTYDMVIQHGYPNCFEYRSDFGQNVCIPEISTYNIRHTGWAERINMMDTVIISSEWSKKSIIEAGCNIPIKMTPEPFNMSHFKKQYDPIFETEKETFVFYYVANHKDKNNIQALLVAFFLEFQKHDDVSLIIKTHKEGYSDHEAEQIMIFDIEQIQKALRINHNNVIKPRILVGHYQQEYIMRLHNQADCFVNVCKCENFGASSIESMLFNNLTIVNEGSGPNTYINNDNGFQIKSMLTNIYSKDFYMEYEYTVHEMWREPYIDSIRKQMRAAYETTEAEKQEKINNFNKDIFTEEHFLNQLFI